MANNVIFREIGELVQKPVVEGDEKLPVSDTEYITPGQIAEKSYDDLSQVAKTGNYEDLNHLPNIPGRLSDLADDYHHRTVTDDEKRVWNNKSDFNGDYNNLTNQPDLSQFITASVNNLVNYYLKSDTYTKEEVQALVSTIQGVSFVPVDTLPSASAETLGKIYLVPSASAQAGNVKDEYITLDNGEEANPRYTWEGIGSTAIDLSGYVTTQALNTALSAYTTTADLNTLLGGKADKVSGATNGNLASLDSNGNLVDSGNKASDFQAKIDSSHKLDYSLIDNAPTLGTAAAKDVPTSGNATSSQVVLGSDSRLTDSRTPKSHTHGNIQNGGSLQTTDVTIANGDKLVVTDSSNSNKIARTSASFDGSTTTKALTQKGTFETFLQDHQDISGKADIVSGATTGHFAGLDSNGNLTDSGKSASDFLPSNTTIPSITLNGSSSSSPSFYAPTGAGTAGQVLTSNGSGAPTWQNAPSGGSVASLTTSEIDTIWNTAMS